MEQRVHSCIVDEQGRTRKRVFYTQYELHVVARYCSSAPACAVSHVSFLTAAHCSRCESPLGRHSKKRWSNGLPELAYGMATTHADRFFHRDLPPHHHPLVVSFDTRLSRSTLDSSSSAQTSHPFTPFQDRHLCIVRIRRFLRFAEALRPLFLQEIDFSL
jgi:hypothetical protein